MAAITRLHCALALMLVSSTVFGFSVKCATGWSTCIATQGIRIPAEQVANILASCEKFAWRNAGAYAVKMSTADWVKEYETNGINSPIVQAYFALSELRQSPLSFEREWERMDYREIVRTCIILRQDFDNPSKWIR